MTNGDCLRAAARRVRAGWCQGAMARGSRVCALGAIAQTVWLIEADQFNHTRYEALRQIVRDALALGTTDGLVHWNDAPDQTAENVAAGFELAAVCADQADAAPVRKASCR